MWDNWGDKTKGSFFFFGPTDHLMKFAKKVSRFFE